MQLIQSTQITLKQHTISWNARIRIEYNRIISL